MRTFGVEAEVKADVTRWLYGYVNATFQDLRDTRKYEPTSNVLNPSKGLRMPNSKCGGRVSQRESLRRERSECKTIYRCFIRRRVFLRFRSKSISRETHSALFQARLGIRILHHERWAYLLGKSIQPYECPPVLTHEKCPSRIIPIAMVEPLLRYRSGPKKRFTSRTLH